MTNLQDKIAALKAGDYDVVFKGTPYMMRGHASIYCVHNAAKVIVLEEQVRVLRSDLQWFVDRVEALEVRSKKSYERFKATLAATDMGE